MRSRSPGLIGLMCWVALPGSLALPGSVVQADQPAAAIEVAHAWIRWLPQNLPAGGYMTLTNTGAVQRVLIGATSPDYAEVSFHQTRASGGTTSMIPLASIAIAPHASVSFSPGGYHIMLMRPARSLHPGDKVPLRLQFADGQSLEVQFEVRAAGGDADSSPAMPGMR